MTKNPLHPRPGEGGTAQQGSCQASLADATPCLRARSNPRQERLCRWLRRRRGAPRPNPEREWSEFEQLRAAERALTAVSWYGNRLENRTVRRG